LVAVAISTASLTALPSFLACVRGTVAMGALGVITAVVVRRAVATTTSRADPATSSFQLAGRAVQGRAVPTCSAWFALVRIVRPGRANVAGARIAIAQPLTIRI